MSAPGKRQRHRAGYGLRGLAAAGAASGLLVLVLSLQNASGDAGLSGGAQTALRACLLVVTAVPTAALAIAWLRR